jgi:hypothetical protein
VSNLSVAHRFFFLELGRTSRFDIDCYVPQRTRIHRSGCASPRGRWIRGQREVRVPGKLRVDIVGRKDDAKTGVEVKFNGRGILDDLVKCQKVLRLSDLDEAYVCGPKVLMSDDVRALASNLKIGLLALTDAGELEWLSACRRLEPARLTVGGGYAKPRGKIPFNVVRPGGRAVWNAAVFNTGEKTAVNLEVFMVTAGPFVAKARSKARIRKPLLERSGYTAWTARLECEVKRGTAPGTYPLMISATADNAQRADDTVPYEVRLA